MSKRIGRWWSKWEYREDGNCTSEGYIEKTWYRLTFHPHPTSDGKWRISEGSYDRSGTSGETTDFGTPFAFETRTSHSRQQLMDEARSAFVESVLNGDLDRDSES